MCSKGFNVPTCIHPYAVDVIRAKRRALVYGISRTEDLLGLLVTEGVMTAAKRSIVLTFGTRKDQNSRLLDHLEAAGERACRIFFHPCLMLAEPDLYRRIKTYAGADGRIGDARRQLIGYLLERDQEGMEDTSGTERTRPPSAAEGTKRSRRPGQEVTSREPAQSEPESLVHEVASDGDAVQPDADKQHPGCVEVLVEEEAKRSESQDAFLHADARNSREKSALFYAVSRKDEKSVTVLLDAGAKVDKDVINEAIRLNAESVLRLLLDNPRGAVSEEALGSALFSAVKQNRDGVVTALIDRGANVNQLDQLGYTPLLWSAELGHAEVFRALVAKQAKLDATLPDLSSALHLAVRSGSEPIVQTLLGTGLDPNTAGAKAQTALHMAAQCNRPELVGLLLRAGAQVDAVGQDGLTPLHVASQQGHADPVVQLLQAEADPGVRDRLGRTALHWAASSPGGGGAVTSLLSHKANGGAKDMDGATALHYAAAAGHASVVSALLRFTNNKGTEERNARRRTPLHVAAERGHGGAAALLLEAGAKVNGTDHSKDTPLHCAARGGHREVARTLVNWGRGGHVGRRGEEKVNLWATNNVGKTPLQVAESGDSPEHESVATFLMRKMFLIK